jgi:hypothetical protein
MTIRLTKKRLQQLNSQLSVDDFLYEKYRRLNQDLQRQWEKLYRAKQIVSVVQQREGVNFQLQIIDIQITPDGTRVTCR